LIAFSGHGLSIPRGPDKYEDHLCLGDANVVYNPISNRTVTETGVISRPWIEEQLDKTQAGTKLFFIDACRNTPVDMEGTTKSKSIKSIFFDNFGDGSNLNSDIKDKKYGLFRFSSCLPKEESYENDHVQHGLFTHFLIEGLQGAADRYKTGRITLDDLEVYVRRETQKFVIENNLSKNQTPAVASFPPDLAIARSEVLIGFCPIPEPEPTPVVEDEKYKKLQNLLAEMKNKLAELEKQQSERQTVETGTQRQTEQLEREKRQLEQEKRQYQDRITELTAQLNRPSPPVSTPANTANVNTS